MHEKLVATPSCELLCALPYMCQAGTQFRPDPRERLESELHDCIPSMAGAVSEILKPT